MKRLDEITLRRMLRESRENAARERLELRASVKKGLRAENTRLQVENELRGANVDLLLKERDELRATNTRHDKRWKLATAPIAFVRTFARALLGDEDGGVRDWMRESGDGTLLEEWHAALAALTRLDAASDSTAIRQLRSGALVLPE